MMRLNALTTTALILVIVGALNWGLVGLFAFDLVAAIFGEMTLLSRIVYTLVGLAGVALIFALLTARKTHDNVHHTTTTGTPTGNPRR